jgi:hypothetical protein
MCFANFASVASTAGSLAGGASLGGYAQLAPSLLGAISKAATASTAASGQRATANYKATVASQNAALADMQAGDVIARSGRDQSQLFQQAGLVRGRQRAATAANGIALDEGSPVNVAASTDWMRDVDLATIRNNAARQAWGYRTQADNYRTQATAYRATASAISPLAAGVTSLLGSASDVSSKWYDLYKGGALGRKAPADSADFGSSLFSSSGFVGG